MYLPAQQQQQQQAEEPREMVHYSYGGGDGAARFTVDVDPTDKIDWLVLFRQFDPHRRHYIPFNELVQKIDAAGASADLSPEERNRLIAGADQNGDKLIDFAEFCALMSRAKRLHMKSVMFRAGQMVVPRSLREEEFSYLQQYSCLPPPLFMLLITVVQIGIYIYYVVESGQGIQIDKPVPTDSSFIYNPKRRIELWRFLTYMFIHIGVYHIVFNSLVQLVLGIPLELVHKPWRIGAVYLLGVIAGSLAVSVSDPDVFLAGASGGVYALIAAHVANLLVNWDEMEFAICRLFFFFILIGADVGFAIYNRYFGMDDLNKVSYVAHLGGFAAGLLMGIVVLRNFRKRPWERVVWWIALIGFLLLVAFAVAWNLIFTFYFDGVYRKQEI